MYRKRIPRNFSASAFKNSDLLVVGGHGDRSSAICPALGRTAGCSLGDGTAGTARLPLVGAGTSCGGVSVSSWLGKLAVLLRVRSENSKTASYSRVGEPLNRHRSQAYLKL